MTIDGQSRGRPWTLEGIIVPLITPLNADETLDEAGLERLVEHVIAGGVSGVFLLGSSGEGPALGEAVKERLVRAVAEQARGRVPVLVGVLAVGTRRTVEEARRLVKQGGDAVVVTAPYYFAHSQAEIAAHVSHVARALDLPVLLYNIPQMVKTIVEPETVARLAEVPGVVGIKDSQGDMVRFQSLLALQASRPEFAVFQGAEGVVALSLARGAAGAVLGLANVAPGLCCELYESARTGNLPRAWALQERLMLLWKLHTRGQWLPCLKMAVSQLGVCGPTASAPFAPLDRRAIAAIRRDMEAAGVSPLPAGRSC